MSEILAVLLGLVLGHGIKIWEERRARQQRRASIASAMLYRLQMLERETRHLLKEPRAAGRGGESHGQAFIRLGESDDLYLFRASTINWILNIGTSVTTMDAAVHSWRNRPNDHLHDVVRANAYFVAHEVRRMRDLLLSEGGTDPLPGGSVVVNWADIPSLPSPAFPQNAAIEADLDA